MRKNKYVYTCPDVKHYRKNQYRLAIWSNVFSVVYVTAFFGGLAALANKANPTTPVTTPAENSK